MTIFSELNAEYKAWRDRYFQDRRASTEFAVQFATGLRLHIGAPETYPDLDGSQVSYVAPRTLNEGTEDDGLILTEPKNVVELLNRGKDGYWRFGVAVALEISPKSWPKQAFGIPIYFIIGEDRRVRMKIAHDPEGEFDFPLSRDSITYANAYDFIVGVLRRILSQTPSELAREKRRIGFTAPQRLEDEHQ